MTSVLCHSDASELFHRGSDRKVLLYGARSQIPQGGTIGRRLREELTRVEGTISAVASDFLSIALGVIAADVFVLRADAPDRFARQIELTVSVSDPEPWHAVESLLVTSLNFLCGDRWKIQLEAGGLGPPRRPSRKHLRRTISIGDAESVCLLSGGLDSLIGVLDLLATPGDHPFLVSRASMKDRQIQERIIAKLPNVPRLSANDNPSGPWSREDTTRTRSFLFLAMGACMASAVATRTGQKRPLLYVPENGLIALNPPLTPRRLGAFSTRTAHPEFLRGIQTVFDSVGIAAEIKNDYAARTKGEMLKNCGEPVKLKALAFQTVSCGRWKRKNQQCGHCVPCLIRRAAFHHGGLREPPDAYRQGDLRAVLSNERHRADLLSVMYAIKRARTEPTSRWVMRSGDLPPDPQQREALFNVVQRGMGELEAFLATEGVTV